MVREVVLEAGLRILESFDTHFGQTIKQGSFDNFKLCVSQSREPLLKTEQIIFRFYSIGLKKLILHLFSTLIILHLI